MMNDMIMFLSMFISQYVFMSYITTDKIENITNSIGKVYMCTLMNLIMFFVANLMADKINIQKVILYGGLLVLTIYLYKIQYGIGDKDYLSGMIEHHSMALLTSDSILKKTDNQNVANLAKRILTTQEKEINEMRQLLKSI